jgi:hypothetical protein
VTVIFIEKKIVTWTLNTGCNNDDDDDDDDYDDDGDKR